ncbi:MAG TPA: hypothetical protein VN774_03690, partial [Candidatus Limnocylindrales bacterium]|nr:hypothetical protein [Candidatus Limnocylindrales bacterium]
MSIRQQHGFAHVAICWAYAQIVRIWPAGSRDWALAMQAELSEINNPKESLSWLAGGVMSLSKAWWNRILLGRDPQEEPAPVKAPGIISVLVLLVAVSSLALPGMRQGIMAVYDSWNFSHAILQTPQLEKMGRDAENNHDASTLALVAMRLPGDSQDKNRWADLAASWDPSKTWIYFQMRNPYRLDQKVDPEISAQIARLQNWDPENAVPYLMQADEVFERFERNTNYLVSGTRSGMEGAVLELAKDPEWASSMNKAFRASRYDDYDKQRFNLNLAYQQKIGGDRPMDLILSTAAGRLPNLLNLRMYSEYLIHDAAQREAAGDRTGATEDYWRSAQFWQRMSIASESVSIKRLMALSMIALSFEKLQSLCERAGHTEEARSSAFELASAKAASKDFRSSNQRISMARDIASPSAFAIHISAILILFAATLSCISLTWLAIGASSAPDSRSTLRRWLCISGRFAPALLLTSVSVFYFSYYPYLESFRSVTFQNMESLIYTFNSLYSLPR